MSTSPKATVASTAAATPLSAMLHHHDHHHHHNHNHGNTLLATPQAPVIHIPRVREVSDYAENEAALRPSSRYADIDPATSAYVRNQDMYVRQTIQQVVTDYDMDEGDEQWLTTHNAKVCFCVCGEWGVGRCFRGWSSWGWHDQLSN